MVVSARDRNGTPEQKKIFEQTIEEATERSYRRCIVKVFFVRSIVYGAFKRPKKNQALKKYLVLKFIKFLFCHLHHRKSDSKDIDKRLEEGF